MARRKLGTGRDRFDSEEDQQAMLNRVYELTIQSPKLSKPEIANMINRSEKMVYIYWQKLIKLGKLKASQSGRPVRPDSAIRNAEYENLNQTDFVKLNPSVQTWITKCQRGGKKGTGVINYGDMVVAFYTVCRTLKVTPDAFLISPSQTAELMEKFKQMFLAGKTEYLSKENGRGHHLIMKSGDDTSVIRYSKAIANFCMRNDKPLPKNMDGALSRKKENYGAYATVQLSDKEIAGMVEFFRTHPEGGEDWAAMVSIHHELILRSETMTLYKANFLFKEIEIDGIVCKYAEAPNIYEVKTHEAFDKLIINPTALEYARKVKQGGAIVQGNHYQVLGKYNRLCREYYASIGRIDPEAVHNHRFYRKVIDGDRYYLAYNPSYTMRHSGCHCWARRCQYNATQIKSLGWKDSNMISDVYGKMPTSMRLHLGACEYCNPQGNIATKDNKFFCSWNHALVYFNNGQISKAEMFANRAKETGVAAA